MRVLVTGSAGFIGGELIELLGPEDTVSYDLVDGNDILDFDTLVSRMRGCDVVVHLAAHRKPYEDKIFRDYFDVNCRGTFNVAEAAVACGVRRMIYSSSTSYYGAEGGIPYVLPLREGNPVMAQHVEIEDLDCRDCDIAYSTSKVIAEQILANYGLTKKLEVVILRLGPTRKRGEFRPFGEALLHLTIDNALEAIRLAIEAEGPLWYEALTITDANPNVVLERSASVLGYVPK